jgi:large subunit ribosomal protein L29
MKVNEIVAKKDSELLGKVRELRDQLIKLRFDIATKESTKSAEVSKHKKTIARVQTILRERELQREEESKNEKKA